MTAIQAKVLLKDLTSELAITYDSREAENLSYELLRHFVGADRMKVALNSGLSLDIEKKALLKDAVQRLQQNEPLQHITGEVEFYGLAFRTDHRALIPRPETEELVDWILQAQPEAGLRVLDIGTGTGCIPICLAKSLSQARVSAIDVSEEALALAKENARINQVEINFQKLDILTEDLRETYDLIVSNPPYIPFSDQKGMAANVLDYEPGTALFVNNDTPLIFYERIAKLAIEQLAAGGNLYYEIHEAYGQEVVDLLATIGFTNIELRKDLQGKDRMIKATKA